MSSSLALKRSGNPGGLGSRNLIRGASVAASRRWGITSAGEGSVPLRMISTMSAGPLLKALDGIREGEFFQVHCQIDGSAAALLRARVVPLGPGGEDLEI